MPFDKTKVFSCVDANEIKVGSKGYVGDDYLLLIETVCDRDSAYLKTLVDIGTNEYPFVCRMPDGSLCPWGFFYLIEEPKESTKRVCTKDELADMLKKQGFPILRKRHMYRDCVSIRSMHIDSVTMCDGNCYTYEELCNYFMLLDGSPLWLED